MAIQIQLRQGTTTEHNTFMGAQGELTYNTTLKSLVLHDGVTLGGVKIPYLSNDLVPSTMLPTATESVVGASKIATTEIAQAGTNDTDILTAKKLRDALNAGGDFPVACFRSYGYIKTSGATVTLEKQLNIASVVRTAVGTYTITFTKPMPNTNYLIFTGLEGDGGQDFIKMSPKSAKTVNGFNVLIYSGYGVVDGANFSFGVIT